MTAAVPITVFLIMGQSNAQGRGNRTQLFPVPAWAQNAANGWTGAPTVSSDSGTPYPHPTLQNSPSLYVENNTGDPDLVVDGWGHYDGCNPDFGYHPGEQGSYGPELSFLARYRAEHPDEQLAAIKVVAGGTGIAEWMSGQLHDYWVRHVDQAWARLTAAGFEPRWGGLVWMQGENGASTVWPYLHPTAGAEYSDQLRLFLSDVRLRTSLDMPVLIGRIGNHMLADNIIGTSWNGEDTPENRRGATLHRRAQQELVAADPGNALVDTDNLPVLQEGDPQWWYHHTGAGYLAMGERFYVALAGVTPPPPPPPALVVHVTINGVEQLGKTATVTLNGVPVGGPGDTLVVVVVDR